MVGRRERECECGDEAVGEEEGVVALGSLRDQKLLALLDRLAGEHLEAAVPGDLPSEHQVGHVGEG